MTLNNLSPKQIVFLYLRHIRYMDVHNEVFESIKELNKEGVETQPTLSDLRDNKHVQMLEDINEVLGPIYEVIIDAQPELYDEIKGIVENPMNLPDSPVEEDEDDDDSLF